MRKRYLWLVIPLIAAILAAVGTSIAIFWRLYPADLSESPNDQTRNFIDQASMGKIPKSAEIVRTFRDTGHEALWWGEIRIRPNGADSVGAIEQAIANAWRANSIAKVAESKGRADIPIGGVSPPDWWTLKDPEKSTTLIVQVSGGCYVLVFSPDGTILLLRWTI
jgi:hypothetical protein